MSSQFSANSSNHVPLSIEASAAALWTFIKARSPRFTFESAVDLFQELNPSPDKDHKLLARRLAQALKVRGIKIKHSNALQAIARLSGNGSWHTCDQAVISRLRFFAFDTDQTQESKFASWNEMSSALRTWTDRLQARGQIPLGVLTLNFSGRVLTLSTPVPNKDEESGRIGNDAWPLGVITPLSEDDDWLAGSAVAIEKLRRHLEENSLAVVDGCAVLYPNIPLRNFIDLGKLEALVPIRTHRYGWSAQVDILLCTDDEDPVAGIELDSVFHDSEEAIERDQLKNTLFKLSGLPMIRIRADDEKAVRAEDFYDLLVAEAEALDALRPRRMRPRRTHDFLVPAESYHRAANV